MNDIPASTITPQRPLRIFLCHSSADKPAVRDLYQRLKADGFEPWLDEEDLLPGQDWQREIPRSVRASDIVIVCLSHGSVNRAGYIQKEIKFALDAADEKPEDAIFIIPLRLEECEVPDRLKRWQWVNLFDPNGYKRLLRTFATQFGANSLPPTIVAAQSEEVAVSRPKNSEIVDSSSMVSTQSGGIDLKANDVAIGQDVVGRDKVVSAGGHVIHAESGSTVVINERPTSPATEYLASGEVVRGYKIIENIYQAILNSWPTVAGVGVLAIIAFLIFASVPSLGPIHVLTPSLTPTIVPTRTPTYALTSTPTRGTTSALILSPPPVLPSPTTVSTLAPITGVVKGTVYVYDSPEISYRVLGSFRDNDKILITGVFQDWYRIVWQVSEGWVAQEKIVPEHYVSPKYVLTPMPRP